MFSALFVRNGKSDAHLTSEALREDAEKREGNRRNYYIKKANNPPNNGRAIGLNNFRPACNIFFFFFLVSLGMAALTQRTRGGAMPREIIERTIYRNFLRTRPFSIELKFRD